MSDWYYGSQNHHWKAVCELSTDWDGLKQSFHLNVGAQAYNGYSYDTISNANWQISFNGVVIGSGGTRFNVAANGYKQLGSASVTYSRQQWDQTFNWEVKVWWNSGFGAGTSTCSGSCWEAQLESHAVTYDGNGGSTPGSQTKWYGTILKLQDTPSYAGYGFDGWKASDGTVYKAGGDYGADVSTTMTAQWHRLYIQPACTVTVGRTQSASSSTPAANGGYARITAAWKVDTTATSGNAAKSVAISCREMGASSWTALTVSGTTTGTSGTATAAFSASTTKAYEVQVTLTDSVQATSWLASVGYGVVTFDVGSEGAAVSFGTPAARDGFTLGMKAYIVGPNGKVFTMPPVIYADSKPAEADVPYKPCLVVVKGGALYLYED